MIEKGNIKNRFMDVYGWFSDGVHIMASILLTLIAAAMIATSVWDIYGAYVTGSSSLQSVMLDAVSLIVIAIAIFDVAKYLMEEEVCRERELRAPDEARKTLTKFTVIISIAVALEGLVFIFDAGKRDITLLIYPVALLLSSIMLIVGMGFYQRLSVQTEQEGQEKKQKHTS